MFAKHSDENVLQECSMFITATALGTAVELG